MSPLEDAFRHSVWASKTLIAVCRGLNDDRLTRTAGGYGSILATLNHYVLSDAGYTRQLTGVTASWEDTGDLAELERRVEETGSVWLRFASEPFDAERILVLEDGAYEVHAGVVLAQALHHASVHREQVCAALTALGVEPPDVQPWAYADATGRGRWLT
jgi:uncharacterized damage-inducible protein DinB